MDKTKISPTLLLTAILSFGAIANASANNCIPKEEAVSLDEFLKETSRFEKLISFQERKILLLEKEKKELQNELSKLMQRQQENQNNQPSQPSQTQQNQQSNPNQGNLLINFKGLQRVAVQEAKVYTDNTPNAFSPYSLFRDERVEIESCDKHGWCKLKEKNLFIKQLAILPSN